MYKMDGLQHYARNYEMLRMYLLVVGYVTKMARVDHSISIQKIASVDSIDQFRNGVATNFSWGT
jgi:hypothetical protein